MACSPECRNRPCSSKSRSTASPAPSAIPPPRGSPTSSHATRSRVSRPGAAIVHTHTHEPALPPDAAAALYLAAYRPILDARPDAILYPTIGLGASFDERYGHHDHLAEAGAIRQGLVDPGSVNFGESAPDGRPLDVDFVYRNGPRDVAAMVERCRRHRLGPSVAIFEVGWLRAILAYDRAGLLPPGTLVKLYFMERGYLGGGAPHFGVPPIREAFDLYMAMLAGSKLPWAVAVLGGSLLDSEIANVGARARRTPARRSRRPSRREEQSRRGRARARIRGARTDAASRRPRRPPRSSICRGADGASRCARR